MRLRQIAFPVLVLSAFFLVISPFAQGAELGQVLKGGGKGAKTYRDSAVGEGALTEKMIENCIILKRDLTKNAEEAQKMKLEADTMVKELKQFGVELEQARDGINKSDIKEVKSYNDNLELYRSKSAKSSDLVKRYNQQAVLFQSQRKQFSEQCENQPYYDDDYNKVVKRIGFGM